MTRDLTRLLRPTSIAIVGGGAWCAAVSQQIAKAGYAGTVWHVHPRDGDYGSIEDLPTPPDATFIGINRDATVDVVRALSRRGAGGAVCFASGFAEVEDGTDRNTALLKAAGDMPFLGPNCYGMINALDGALLWPDQHGAVPVERGVALLTQSSNIAINLTMQARGLPIAYVMTCGNQAQTSQAQIAMELLSDDRVTAIGLHIEGFGDPAQWQALSRAAHAKGIPLVALKIGQSEAAQEAAISHTASLAGSDAGAQALLDHLGIARVFDLPTLLETLKLLHVVGPLPSLNIASMSCSGGEASLVADMAQARGLTFPALTPSQKKGLSGALGPKVTLANPLDYHTYVWRDQAAMAQAFSAMIEPHLALSLLVLDFPRNDLCDDRDWDIAVAAALDAKAASNGNFAVVATLPELLPEHRAAELIEGGVVPLCGLAEALNAVKAAVPLAPSRTDILLPGFDRPSEFLDEATSKAALALHGVNIPQSSQGDIEKIQNWAANHTGPFVLKTVGLAHKTEAGGIALGLEDADAITRAAASMPGDFYLIESMVENVVAELLVGVTRDPAHGFVLTLGAGGVFAELLSDTTSVLVPASRSALKESLSKLKTAPVLFGYRGGSGADIDAILDAIEAVQAYVVTNADTLEEVEINPLLCTQNHAIAADALIRKAN